MRDRGFTLMELILVVGFMALMMPMIFSVGKAFTTSLENDARRRELIVDLSRINSLIRKDVQRANAAPPSWGAFQQDGDTLILGVGEGTVVYDLNEEGHLSRTISTERGQRTNVISKGTALGESPGFAVQLTPPSPERPLHAAWTVQTGIRTTERIERDAIEGFATSRVAPIAPSAPEPPEDAETVAPPEAADEEG